MGADVTKKLEIIISSKANLTDAAKISKAFGQVKDRLTELSRKLGITGKRMGGFMRQAQIGREKVKALSGQMKTQATQVDKLEKKIQKLEIRLKKQSTTTSKVDKTTKRYRKTVDQLGKSYKRTEKEARHYDNTQGKIRGHTEGLRRVVGALRNQILLFLFALRGVIDVITSSVEASNQLESALVGLRAVTEKTGTSFYDANKFILEFTETGLISVASTAAGLKNLLSAGFGMPEAIQLMKTLGDAAAFNRQGTLEYGAAIEGATQGIKNQNCCKFNAKVYDCRTREYRSIEDVHENWDGPFYTLSYNEENGELEYDKVTHSYFNGIRGLLKIALETGEVIEVTEDHRVYTKRGWIEAGELVVNEDEILAVDNHTEIIDYYDNEIELEYNETEEGYEINCLNCNKTIKVPKRKLGRKKFCSKQCHNEYREKNQIVKAKFNKTCLYCEKPFHVKPSKMNRKKFCSIECKKNWYKENGSTGPQPNINCDYCGTLFYKKPFRLEKDKNHFCSQRCKGKYWTKNYKGENGTNYQYGRSELIKHNCSLCNKEFEIEQYKIKRNVGNEHFCSDECLSIWRSGQAIKQGLNQKFIYMLERADELGIEKRDYLSWRREVKKRYKGCYICGKNTGKIDIHHSISVKERGDLVLETDNGVTLCSSCHFKVHGIKRIFSQKFSKVLSIENSEEFKVYDLTVEKNHNFMADQMIVHNCVAYHTQIYDPVRGQTKTIEEWHDEGTVPCVLSVNRQTGEMEVIQAEYLHYNGENEVFEIELENGTTIEATSNHRFLTQDGFKFLEDLDLDNDVLYYVDEEEVEDIICEERKSITGNNTIVHNIMVDNDSKNFYIETKQYKEESCQDAPSVEKNYQKEKVDFVPKNVVRDGTKKNTELNLKQKDVPTVIKNFLERQLIDSVHPNVLSNIKLRNQEKNQKSAPIAQRSSSQKSQKLSSVVTNAQQSLIRNQRQAQNEASNVLTVEKTSSVEARENLRELSSVQMNVSGSTKKNHLKLSRPAYNVEKSLRLKRKQKDNWQRFSVQEAVHQNTMGLEEKKQAQEFLQKLQLNARSAEEILNLIEDWSKEDLDYFVQKSVDQKLLVSNSVEKIALALLLELRKYVKNAEESFYYSPGKSKEEKDFVQNNVKTKLTQERSQERTIQTTNMETLEKERRLDLQQSSSNGDSRSIREIPFDVYDAVEMLKVILTHIIFTEQENSRKENLNQTMVSPFVKTATLKSINLLNQHLKNFQSIIPTPLRIKRIISRGFKKTFDLSVPEQFNYLASYIVSHNSIMTDNAGITKNLNIMYKEFARTIGKGAMSLSEMEKRQAIYVGFLKEGAIFQGNMNLLTATYIGKTQKLSQSIFKAKAAFGGLIKEGLAPFVAEIEKVIAVTAEWIKENEVLIKTEVKVFLEALVAGLRTTWDMLIGVNDALKIFGVNIKDVIVFFTLFKGASLIIGKLTGLVGGLAGAIKFALGVQVVSAVAKVTRLQGVLWKLGLLFRSLGGAAGIAAKGVMLFKGAIAILGGPIGAIIVAVTALASAFGFLWLKNKQATKEAEEATRQYKTELRELIQIRHDESLSIINGLEKKLADKKITRDQRIEIEKLLVVEREHEQFLRTRKVVEDARKAFEEEKMISKMRFESVERFGNLSRDLQKEKMEALEAEIQEEKGLFNLSQRLLDSKKKGFEDAKIDRELTGEEIVRGDELLKQAQDRQDLGAKGIGTLELTLKYMRDIYGYEKKVGEEEEDIADTRGKSLKSLLALIERLKGEINRMGLIGIGRQLEDFKTKMTLLEVQYAEFVKTIGVGNKHLKTLRDILNELGERGPLDILNKTFRELRKEIESIGIDPLSDKINKHNERMEEMRLGWSQFEERLTPAQMGIVGVKERLQEVSDEIDLLDQKFKERLVTDEIRKWAEESAQSINQLSASIRDMAFAGIREPIFGGLFGAGQRGEVDRLKIQIEGYEKLTEAQQRYALAEARLQDMKDRGAITEWQRLNELADARERLEVETTLIQQEETFKRIELARSEWQQRLDMIESLIGGWQQLGETWGELQWGQANEMEAQMDRQRDLLDRGKIDIQQYNDRVKQIEQAAQKDREKIRAQFLANLIRQAGQVAQQYFIQAAAGQLAGASSMAAAATQWAAFFTAQAEIHAGLAANPFLAPIHGPIALSYGIAAGASATLGAAASTAGAVGLAALGAGIGVVSGLAASAIESNNLGSEGGFLGTPTEDVFEDRNKRLGGSIRAQEVHLSINPVTYIQAEGDIFIGEGITVETFKGLVNEAFVNRAQDALDTGELNIDELVNVKG